MRVQAAKIGHAKDARFDNSEDNKLKQTCSVDH
jgi:hypothetical protein